MRTKLAVVLSVILMALASLVFLGMNEKGMKGTPLQLVILLGLMALFFLLGVLFKGQRMDNAPTSTIKPLLLGFSVIVPFWCLAAIAKAKLNPVLFFVALIMVLLFYGWVLRRYGWLSLPGFLFFGVGWYVQNILQALGIILFAMHNPGRALMTAAVDLLIVFVIIWAINRTSKMTGEHAC